MAWTMQYTGLTEFSESLNELANAADDIASKGLYDGARVIADAIAEAVDSLPIDNRYMPTRGKPLNVIGRKDLHEVKAALGIAKFRHEMYSVDTSVGFDGYLSRKEKNYPNGVPIPMVVASIEHGSSFRKKNPFIRKAANAMKAKAQAAIAAAGLKMVDDIMKK